MHGDGVYVLKMNMRNVSFGNRELPGHLRRGLLSSPGIIGFLVL